MAFGWYVVPYVRRNPGETPPERYCAMDDFTVLIRADGGDWDETEILGDKALVKVRASPATLTTISGAAGFFTIPTKWVDMQDDPDADVTTTGWTTTPLFSKVNDASDASVITATAS